MEAFDLWRTFESFTQIDSTMPRKLRDHFNFLERNLIQNLAWIQGSNFVKNCIEIRKQHELLLNKEQEIGLDEMQKIEETK